MRQFVNGWNSLLGVEIDVSESMSLLIGASVTLYRYDFLFATLADTSTCSSHQQVYMWVWGLDVFRDEAAALPAPVLHVILPRWHQRCIQSPIPVLTFLPCSNNGPLSQSSSRVSTSFAVCECAVPHHLATLALMASFGQTWEVSLAFLRLVRLCFNCRGLRFSRFPQPRSSRVAP